MSYKLEKPYTDTQRADFVVSHQGMKSIETEDALYFLEDYEQLQNGEIINVSETDEYKAKVLAEENAVKKAELQAQIDELDKKRIRAGFEPTVKDETTGQTWLEYYNQQIADLRAQISQLN